MILLQGQGLACVRLRMKSYLKILRFIFKKIHALPSLGEMVLEKSTLLKCWLESKNLLFGAVSKKKDLSIGYLDQYCCHPVFPHRLGRNGASLRRCGNFEETSAKAVEQLGDPDLLSDPVAYELALRRYDQLQEELEPKECVWLRV